MPDLPGNPEPQNTTANGNGHSGDLPATPKPRPDIKTRFQAGSERTKELSRKANEAKRLARIAASQPPPERPPPQAPGDADPYVLEQLRRARKRLDRIDERLDQAIDAGNALDVEKFTRARAALEEQERRYAGRSLPPITRVAEEKRRRGSLLAMPPPPSPARTH